MGRRILLGVVVLLAAFMVYRASSIQALAPHPYLSREGVMILAHQGASGHAPSDTVESFDMAVDMGADVLELDVHLTKDGQVVVAHDESIDRLTNGTGLIKNMTLAELRQYDFGYDFTPDGGTSFPYRGKGVVIPTLDEIFQRYPQMPINIEIKQNDPPMEQPLWAVVQKHNRKDDIMIASFHTEAVDRWRELTNDGTAFGSPTGYMYEFAAYYVTHLDFLYAPKGRAFQIPTQQKLGPLTIKLADTRLIDRAHKLGVKVHYWTINDEETMRQLIELGADGIITDYPDRAYKVLKEMGKR